MLMYLLGGDLMCFKACWIKAPKLQPASPCPCGSGVSPGEWVSGVFGSDHLSPEGDEWVDCSPQTVLKHSVVTTGSFHYLPV